jgi:hypothetical protein
LVLLLQRLLLQVILVFCRNTLLPRMGLPHIRITLKVIQGLQKQDADLIDSDRRLSVYSDLQGK